MSRATVWKLDGKGVVDFQFNYERPLFGQTILSSKVEVLDQDNNDTLSIEAVKTSNLKVNVLLKGGTPSKVYKLKCTATTDKGEFSHIQAVQVTNN